MATLRTASSSPRTGGGTREARIGEGARVRGRIGGDGDLTIEGSVEGDIAITGNLVLASGASARSDIEAQEVSISGDFEGSVRASGPVRIASGAKVRGDVRGSSVAIDEGAEYAGKLECEFDLPPELEAPRGRR
jgi:cytoskeletal protein CcmA (bactofilin family)